MVYLSSLNILDTGFLDVATRTNQLASGSRVNSGVALQLKGATFDLTATANLDSGVTPAYSPDDIKGHEQRALVSVNPIDIKLKIALNSDYTTTSNPWGVDDMAILAELYKLVQTKGWKAIYYPVDNTATDVGSNTSRKRDSQIVYQMGATDTAESQGDIDITIWTGTTSASSKDLTDVNYIPVRFESITLTQTSSNTVTVTMTGKVTG